MSARGQFAIDNPSSIQSTPGPDAFGPALALLCPQDAVEFVPGFVVEEGNTMLVALERLDTMLFGERIQPASQPASAGVDRPKLIAEE